MRIEKLLKTQQPNIHRKLNKNRKQNNKKRRREKKENISFNDCLELMKYDSYCKGRGIKQRTRGK
ncbi:hypothetical protein ACLD43_05605 [Clostridium botulinum]|uniref:hypothetical protein n=1 Tax=Clostridium botulinum TaxID=1491 RepID=UPI003A80FF9D